jgi:hypothetical protein
MPLSNEQWFGSDAPGAITGTNTANPAIATNSTSAYTFSSQALGDAAAGRIIVIAVGVGWNGGGAGTTITSVTVGGEYAVQQVEAVGGNDGGGSVAEIHRAEVWAIVYPDDTTADVIVNLSATSGNNRACLISVFRMVGDVVITATDTGDHEILTSASTGATLTVDVNAKNRGFVVAATAAQGGLSVVWTGVTEAADAKGVTTAASTGFLAPTADDATLTVSPAWTVSYDSAKCLAVASWHPQ